MLHSNMPQMNRDRRPAAAPSGEAGVGDMINFAFGLVRRQYPVILVSTALALALAVFYLRITPPTYKAEVQVMLDDRKAQYVKQESPLAEPDFDITRIESQIQIVRSSAVAIPVIKQMNLAQDPDLTSAPLSLSSIWRSIRNLFAPPDQTPPRTAADEPPEGLIAAFENRLRVNRVSFSNIIGISYSSRSPVRAAAVANAVANVFINDQMNSRFEANRRATAWLQDRLQRLGDQARAAERDVDAFKVSHNMVSSGGKPLDEQQITDLNARLVATRAQASDALARLNSYQAILHADAKNASTTEALGAVSDALSSPVINSLRTQYLELYRRESEWAARFGKNHVAVVNLRTRMRDVRNSIRDEVGRLAATAQSDYDVAVARQKSIEKQLDDAVSKSRGANSAEVALRDLEAKAKGYRSLYETFQHRYMGAVQQESYPISEARVIYPALPPDSKSKPKSALILALGAFGGVALGLGLGLLREMMDRVFRTSTEVETALQTPCLALTPRVQAPKSPKITDADIPLLDAERRQRIVPRRSSIDSSVVATPLSRYVEAIRAIKIGIDLSPSKTSNKVIGITSALPNEGKTTTAASLARLIAHGGGRVIAVDCDLRNPSLSASLAPGATTGLLEVLRGVRPLEEAIWRDRATDLAFLPVAWRRDPPFHTSEILASEATHKLFDRLRAAYDYVIVDLPPLSPLVDARAAASFTDCFVLVIEWGRTKVDVVQHALHNAPNVYENLVGAVLNKTDVKAMTHYDSHRSDYYSDRHYARYGATERV
ncbi:polysaccharide biosynthesis tyrosine autokinase [Rhodoblastus acidophilus]|uniref:polysaccharide biosynthesis tyrosine autokinase n=1 Tax=Candidatus Rhodoblastus alkanivorans TaxID=2954117 RepID=UPI001FA9B4B5|nr:polysaccharide biosynthesis tyrosine autokinase [Candidatus Rhodoblastus alkanivorans]MCI4677063.1 polysaccharide biosynthesis tyrosine autokinase [Candidatus Rhodoblastus alkanivorans]MDI4641737.1 polysaccharide biosynthesis tyrosine autokinase [Rhodoblastus acidophilus]